MININLGIYLFIIYLFIYYIFIHILLILFIYLLHIYLFIYLKKKVLFKTNKI